MKKDTPEIQYKKYIAEVKRQLEEAKKQIERIPKLEETSNMTYDEFYELYSIFHKF
jgi:hypothetical protein